jgi:hypothetical protein
MSKKVDEAKTELLDRIDRAVEPRKMSAADALEVLEQLRDDIEMRIEGLRDDIKRG